MGTVNYEDLAKKMSESLKQETSKCSSIEDYVNLAYSYKFFEYDIKPIQIKNEIQAILEILNKNKPKTLLEIGTSNGGTFFLLSRCASSQATLLSVDLLGGKFGGELFPEWKTPFYESFAKDQQKIHIIRADSHDDKTLSAIKDVLNGTSLDFLLIDGDHTYEGIKKDFEMYSKLVSEGGIIAFHDINPGPIKDVGDAYLFWNEIKSKYPSIEIIDDESSQGYGIGLVFLADLKKNNASPGSNILNAMIELRERQLSITKSKFQFLLETLDKNPLGILLSLYYKRDDLRRSFPEVQSGEYKRLVLWASKVISGQIKDEVDTKKVLSKFSSWYSEYLAEKRLEEENTRLEEENKRLFEDIQHEQMVNKNLDMLLASKDEQLDTLKTKFTLQKDSEDTNPLRALLMVYSNRADLQNSFPEVKNGKIDGLLKWAVNVVLRYLPDSNYDLLLPHGAWYMRKVVEPKPKVFKEGTKLGEAKKVYLESRKKMKERGLTEYLRDVQEKIEKREFKILETENPILSELKIATKQAQMKRYHIKPESSPYFVNCLRQNISSNFDYQPKISIIMPVYNVSKNWLERSISSVFKQVYENWELCLVDDASTENHVRDVLEYYAARDNRVKIKFLEKNQNISGASNAGLKLATGKFVSFLDHDDELTFDALYEFVKCLNLHKDAEIIYSDDAKINEQGEIYDRQFKPNWSPELLLSYAYFSHMVLYRKELLDVIGRFRPGYEGAQDYDLALRATEKTDKIFHIPKILYLWRAVSTSTAQSPDNKIERLERGRKAVQDTLDRRNLKGTVVIPEFAQKSRLGIHKINFELKRKPKVSIIIPTKDRVEFLKKCITSIENKISYNNYEIIIIDSGSTEKSSLKYLKESKHRVISLNMPMFNFSRLNNEAVSQANGEYVLLLNNDVEIITPNLLEEMLGYFESDKKVGVVGAKLLYKNNRVQHGGVLLGLNNGLAGHANKLRKDWDPGYLWYASVSRNFSAVTAAFMMIPKKLYQQVGGMDERNLTVSYNDVDLCLKVIENGYRVVYNPYALAYHYEGASRGIGPQKDSSEEERYLKHKWYHYLRRDPFYNPNLSLEDENFKIKFAGENDKKILLITHNLNHEGASRLLFNLARGLRDKGYHIMVLSPNDGPLKYDYYNEDIDVIIEPFFFSNPQNATEFFEQFDLVYVNTMLNYVFIKFVKNAGIPIIWCIMESERQEYIRKGVNESHFQLADKVVFDSDATRKIYSDLEYNKNFLTINGGVNIEEIESFKIKNKKDELREKYGFSVNDKIITIVGTVTERKGQQTFVEAAKNLLQTYDPTLKFLIVGAREGKYLQKIKQKLEGFANSDNIHLISETKSIYDYYHLSDIFVNCSLRESFPMVILEYMAFERPIIASNVCGIPEQLEDGKDGILIPPNDSKILSNKIKLLLKDKNLGEQFVRNAHEILQKQFTQDIVVSSHDKLIQKITTFPLIVDKKQ